MDSQKCRVCGVVLTEDNAWPNRTKGRFQTACKPCSRAQADRWRNNNREREKERSRRYYRQNRDQLKDTLERGRLRRKYGLTREEIEQMKQSQNGLCAVCQVKPAMVVDHCHSSNLVRSILCSACNSAIGLMKEDPERLRKAAAYVEAWNSKLVETRVLPVIQKGV